MTSSNMSYPTHWISLDIILQLKSPIINTGSGMHTKIISREDQKNITGEISDNDDDTVLPKCIPLEIGEDKPLNDY